jgi:hypothetical protein
LHADRLQTAIDDNQAMIAVISQSSADDAARAAGAGSFDHTLADIYQNVALVAVIS